MDQEAIAANLETWEAWTESHFSSDMYALEDFKKGQNRLKDLEIQEVGDVVGKSLLHLQCHFGLDTLSWEQLGAIPTGVDFSPKAIAMARRLASELNYGSQFVCSSVYDLQKHLEGQFDVVFTSYGVLTWLPDVKAWAEIVAHYLKPGGLFYIAEFHPTMCLFDNRAGVKEWRLYWPYFNRGQAVIEENTGSYADPDSGVKTVAHEFPHAISEVVQSLIDAGLTIRTFREHNFSCWQFSELLSQGEDGLWRVTDPAVDLPLTYSISATKLGG